MGEEAAKPGDRIGRYVLLEVLGTGGMGVVFAAHDPELDRRVAVKLIRPDRSQGTLGSSRLLREARALAKLSHPCVVEVFDVGLYGDAVYMAMELIEGKTFAAWAALPTRTTAEILDIARQAARGLGAAHRGGLVHRDFKPANVVVDRKGRAKVIDFGLALQIEDASSSSEVDGGMSEAGTDSQHRLTKTGVVMGTPLYMAPEQHGRSELDARSDQFSFCASVYEMVFRVRPFAGTTMRQLVRDKLKSRVEPPAVPGAPRHVRLALLRGLSPKPEDRFPSMEALLAAMSGRPHQKLLAAVAVAALAGVGVAAIAFAGGEPSPCTAADAKVDVVWNDAHRQAIESSFAATEARHAEQAAGRAVSALDAHAQAWVQMRNEACVANRVEDIQSDEVFDLRVSCLDERLVELETLVTAFEDADRAVITKAPRALSGLGSLDRCADVDALRTTASEPPNPREAAVVADARRKLLAADIYEQAGKFTASERATARAKELADTVEYAPLRAETSLRLGKIAERSANYDEAVALLEDAAFVATAEGDDGTAANAKVALVAVVGYHMADYDQAQQLARDARAAISRVPDPEAIRARLSNNLGITSERAGRYDESLEHHREVLAIRERTLDARHIDLGTAWNNLGNAHHGLGQQEQAKKAYEQALAIWLDALGPGHPDVGGLHNNLSSVAMRTGELTEAGVQAEAALSIWTEAYGPTHPAVATAMINLANVVEGDDLERAVQLYKDALAILELAHDNGHPSVAICASNLGSILLAADRHAEARPYFERAVGIVKQVMGEEHPSLAYPLTGLGEIMLDSGDPRASDTLARGLELHERGAADPLEVAAARFALARAKAGDGHRTSALALATQARAEADRSPQPSDEAKAEIDAFIATL